MTTLLGDKPKLFKDKVNFKLPGSRADKLHQDQAAGWNSYADFFVTWTVAIDANMLDNAPISVMRSGNYKRNLMNEQWMPLSNEDPPYQPQDEFMVCEAEPGDVLIFDSFVPHGSPPNTSARSRRNLFLTFNRASAGDHRASYYADKQMTYPPNAPSGKRTVGSWRV